MSTVENMSGHEAVNILSVICYAEVGKPYAKGSGSAPGLLISHL